ncbi:Uncharacterised protein [Streptococcus pneumoniae]|nr:Uncharacterised protein [Streptococcus pneumoniae]
METIFVSNIQHALQVLAHEETTIHNTVQNQVASQTNQVGFVHPDIDLASLQFRQRGKHAINQVINLFFANEKNVLYITELLHFLDTPFDKGRQVGQGLDAWYKGHVKLLSIGFYFLQLLC